LLQGVFIANQLSTMMDGGGMGGMGGMGMKRTVVTRITFNGGGSWQPIKAPTTFNYQKCNRCGGATNCALHLHGKYFRPRHELAFVPYISTITRQQSARSLQGLLCALIS
jgi:hypothetical protein